MMYKMRPNLLKTLSYCLASSFAWGSTSLAADDDGGLLDLSLEQLLSVEITSAARKSQSLSETAAAVYVITSDAIRASGARSIPTLLRLAPGLQVSRIDGNRWAISARGFNGRFANKLLVMVDGRTVYTPSFAGVYWESLDTLIDDIDRIEVIRGPGSSVWGANAVNGVIHIITRSARVTQGTLLTANGDDKGGVGGALRYGGNLNDNAQFRVYGKINVRGNSKDVTGLDVNDDYQGVRVGGRFDIDEEERRIAVAAEIYSEDIGETLLLTELAPPYASRFDAENDIRGAFINASWTNQFESGELALRTFVDNVDRQGALFGEKSTTYDVDLQWSMNRRGRHELMFGLGYRRYTFDFLGTPNISLLPVTGADTLISAFVQDEIHFADGNGRLTLGAKFEQDERSSDDVQIMPTLRVSYQLGEASTLWASATRSIRTPSYADYNVMINGIGAAFAPLSAENPLPVPMTTAFVGSPQTTEETVVALESGVRWQISDTASADVALYFNEYDDLRTASNVMPVCQPSGVALALDPLCFLSATHVENTLRFENSLSAKTHGIEVATHWVPTDRLRLEATYSYLDVKFGTPPVNGNNHLFPNAKHQFSLRTDWRFAENLRLGARYHYADELPGFNLGDDHDLNLRLSWRPMDEFELALAAERLMDSGHVEFLSELGEGPPTVVERRFVAQIRWLF